MDEVHKELWRLLAKADPKIDGDKARIEVSNFFDIELVRKDNHWKIDIALTLADREHFELAGWADRCKAREKAYHEIADRVSRGEFKTVEAIVQVVQKKV